MHGPGAQCLLWLYVAGELKAPAAVAPGAIPLAQAALYRDPQHGLPPAGLQALISRSLHTTRNASMPRWRAPSVSPKQQARAKPAAMAAPFRLLRRPELPVL
jgi:hypothetical protein